MYGTVMGSLGALLPITLRDDGDFFSHLEMYLRLVIDGDLCEQFPTLTLEKQQRIANELDTARGEIFKKLEQVRNKIV